MTTINYQIGHKTALDKAYEVIQHLATEAEQRKGEGEYQLGRTHGLTDALLRILELQLQQPAAIPVEPPERPQVRLGGGGAYNKHDFPFQNDIYEGRCVRTWERI